MKDHLWWKSLCFVIKFRSDSISPFLIRGFRFEFWVWKKFLHEALLFLVNLMRCKSRVIGNLIRISDTQKSKKWGPNPRKGYSFDVQIREKKKERQTRFLTDSQWPFLVKTKRLEMAFFDRPGIFIFFWFQKHMVKKRICSNKLANGRCKNS